MTPILWTAEKVQRLIQAPERLIAEEPWRTWVMRYGGIRAVHSLLRTFSLKHKHRRLLELILDHPGMSVTFYADTLSVHFTTFHAHRKELSQALAQFLNSMEQSDLASSTGMLPIVADISPVIPTNLPQPLSSFVGRQHTIATILEHVQKTRLWSLVGTGGIGKTRLALEIGRRLLPRYPDGVWLIDLVSLTSAASVATVIAGMFAVDQTPHEDLVLTLANGVSSRRMLIVFDTCEHLLDAVTTVINAVLSRAPGIDIMVTSREPLGLAGEYVCRIDPLTVPPHDVQPLHDRLAAYESVQLFLERAASHATLNPLHLDLALVASICVRLDGLPLALELAAIQLRFLSLSELAARLDERFHLLNKGRRGAIPRHRSLQALMDWTFTCLTTAEQVVFTALAVFSGGWTLQAAETVLAEHVSGPLHVVDRLGLLVDKSLVHFHAKTEPDRYQMLETIRLYAQQRLTGAPHEAATRTSHLRYYAELAAQEMKIETHEERLLWIQQIEVDLPNIRAAFAWGLAQHQELAICLAAHMGRFWYHRGSYKEGRAYLEQILELPDSAETILYAKVLRWLGVLYSRQADYPQASATLMRCLRLYEQWAPSRDMGHIYNDLGLISLNQLDYSRAWQWFEASLALWRQAGNQQHMITVLNNMSLVLYDQCQYHEALAYCEECLVLSRLDRNAYGTMLALVNMGTVVTALGDAERGQALLSEALVLAYAAQNTYGIAATLNGLAIIALQRGGTDEMRRLLHESLSLFQDLSDQRGIILSVECWAALHLSEGRSGVAALLLGASAAARDTHHIPISPHERFQRNATIAELALRLGVPVTLSKRWHHGALLSLQRIVRLLLTDDAFDVGLDR